MSTPTEAILQQWAAPRRKKKGLAMRTTKNDFAALMVDRSIGNITPFYPVGSSRFCQLCSLIKLKGQPCDAQGNSLPLGAPPPQDGPGPDDWLPFESEGHFELADFVYRTEQMSGNNIDFLLKIIGKLPGNSVPFKTHEKLYDAIDAIPTGNVKWEKFIIKYNGPLPEGDVPHWMTVEHEIYHRDPCLIAKAMLSNRNFDNEIDYAPYREYDANDLQRYHHFMSGNWAWKQAVSHT